MNDKLLLVLFLVIGTYIVIINRQSAHRGGQIVQLEKDKATLEQKLEVKRLQVDVMIVKHLELQGEVEKVFESVGIDPKQVCITPDKKKVKK